MQWQWILFFFGLACLFVCFSHLCFPLFYVKPWRKHYSSRYCSCNCFANTISITLISLSIMQIIYVIFVKIIAIPLISLFMVQILYFN